MKKKFVFLIFVTLIPLAGCESFQKAGEIAGFTAQEFLASGGKEVIGEAISAGVDTAMAKTEEERIAASEKLTGAVKDASNAAVKAVTKTVEANVPEDYKPYVGIAGSVLNLILAGFLGKGLKGTNAKLKSTRGTVFGEIQPLKEDLLVRKANGSAPGGGPASG